jgi:hypothetical protein
MLIKNYIDFINEDAVAPPAQSPPAQAAPSGTTQAQAQPASGTTQAQAQPASGTTQAQAQPVPTQSQPTEEKIGDLSNYNNQSVTENPDTVKKMVDLIKDMDKQQLIKLRAYIAELKNINDPKNEIGKL